MSSRCSTLASRPCTQRLPWRSQYLRPRRGGFGVEPGQRRRESPRRLLAARRGQPVATRNVELAVEHDAGRLPRLRPAGAWPARRTSGDQGAFAAGKDGDLVTDLHAAAAGGPQHARLLAGARALSRHVLHRQREVAKAALHGRRQALQQLQQRRPAVPRQRPAAS